jgi:3-hydroxyacyl-[acyl-carrier-protein] dehydratase
MSTRTDMSAPVLHRQAAPLVAIDDVALDGTGAVATKLVQAEDPYLEGHYPNFPIYPGIFIIESVVQTHRAACQVRGMDDPGPVVAFSSVRFRIPVFPGDTLVVRTSVEDAGADGGVRVKGRCEKDGAVAAQVTLVFAGSQA